MSLEERVLADIETIKLDIKDLLRINVNQQLTHQQVSQLKKDFEKSTDQNRKDHIKLFENVGELEKVKIDRDGLTKVVGLMFTAMGFFFTFIGILLYIFKVKL